MKPRDSCIIWRHSNNKPVANTFTACKSAAIATHNTYLNFSVKQYGRSQSSPGSLLHGLRSSHQWGNPHLAVMTSVRVITCAFRCERWQPFWFVLVRLVLGNSIVCTDHHLAYSVGQSIVPMICDCTSPHSNAPLLFSNGSSSLCVSK
jgi:hypothetical protein